MNPQAVNSTAPQLERRGDALLVRAPAKINLDLLVAPRRADGYHDLDSLTVKVSLYDELRLAPEAGGNIRLSCRGADCGDVEKNLVYRAAKLLTAAVVEKGVKVATGTTGLSIELIKRTPPGKGLGGGSSDAAATLMGLNELWQLGWHARLPELAASLGSDVPLFLGGPACRMTGRGEVLQPITVHPFVAVLILSDLFCATLAVYKAFDELRPGAQCVAGVSPAICGNTDTKASDREMGDTKPGDSDTSLLRRGKPVRAFDIAQLLEPPSSWRHLLVNDLLTPALVVCPALAEIQASLQSRTNIPICMTGSGSALFALCDDQSEVSLLLASLDDHMRQMCICVQSNPW